MKTVLLIMVSLFTFMQMSWAAEKETPPPGSIKLLPSYHHKTEHGIDTWVGRIWKDKGLEIRYDIGYLAGNYAECGHLCGWTDGELWREEQIVGGERVICVYTSKKRLIISFPKSHANFYATVRSNRELSDMLLMVLTYRP